MNPIKTNRKNNPTNIIAIKVLMDFFNDQLMETNPRLKTTRLTIYPQPTAVKYFLPLTE